MKYLFLVYGDEARPKLIVENERDAYNQACRAYDEALRASGYLTATARLQNSDAATVRVQNEMLVLNEGLVAETKEQLFALYFITAWDLNEAVRLASRMPQARRGFIQIRATLLEP